MALWHCENCTTAFAPDLERCPHCGEPARQATSLPVELDGTGAELPDASDEEREHPGTGEVVEAIEAPADGAETEVATEEPKPKRRKSNNDG